MRATMVGRTGGRPGAAAGVAVALLCAAPAGVGAQGTAARDSAVHALNRLAWGPRPGEADRVAATGVMAWIERQLSPERIPDDWLHARERAFTILHIDPDDLARRFVAARQEQLARRRGDTVAADPPPQPGTEAAALRRLGAETQQLVVVRAVLSERQLYEVLVDFWANHFNVFYAKGADRYLLPAHIEETIRPHALGRFEDLLIATAHSPAMLFYLDNAQSVAPGSQPPIPPRATRRLTAEQREVVAQRMPRGLNENYARELLELHTLGVDGGYTQDDIVNVARILTGWGIERPGQGAGFAFREWAHDRGEKVVLGERFPPGQGMDEGIRLLRMLARHPATMHHVSRKLCARFVADDPPDGCVDAAVAAWRASDGQVGAVVRAIVRTPDFWAPAARRAKVKSPLEFVVSAVRATGAAPDSSLRLAQLVGRLGQPLYLQPAPTGWPEAQADWVNAGALLARMNAAVALAGGRLPGATVDLQAVLPHTTDHAQFVDLVNERLLAGSMTDRTRAVILDQLRDVRDPFQARALAVGLAIGGPEFQRQ
jgi:uncharacterized protein (DUF1800 family)